MTKSPVLPSLVLAMFTLLNAAILYLFLLQYPFRLDAFVASFGDWSQSSPRVAAVVSVTVVAVVLAVLLTARLSDAWKNRLLYFRLQHAHPAHQAFFGGKEPGFDLKPLNRAYPQVRDSA